MENEDEKNSSKKGIVKQGWVWKKGECIRNWRLRFFILLENGQLLGFKKNPHSDLSKKPLNSFHIKGCEICELNSVKPFVFIIKCLQRNCQVERTFSSENDNDRKEWISSIEAVSDNCPISCLNFESEKIGPEDFDYIQVLGRGTFGKVMLYREKVSGELFAIKVLKKEALASRHRRNRSLIEHRILKRTNHPFLTSLKYSFQTADHLCFVMHYVNGGELFFHLRNRERFSEERSRFYGAEIISALSYLHSLNIVYRDIKSENILLDKDGHVKLVDFGLCQDGVLYEEPLNSFCGTPEYMAPEIIRRMGYGREVDWWSTGIVMYEMMCGGLPFCHRNNQSLFSLILLKRPAIPMYLSDEAKDLINGLLEKNPKERLDGTDVKKHSFFKSIDWFALEERKISPPFVPQIENDEDTRYFDFAVFCQTTSFTPPTKRLLAKEVDEVLFGRFSFVDSRI
ncbi:hypothetical protein FQA39_LY10251 [Lamprigera yunnana]|nr:hypothetical protein FQA39_LY10251 [Lamprigera yunnana]